MAQIIKHRRGSLESVLGATKRAGELMVITGSSGITAANGDTILFFGTDGSTVTPANKILQGTSVPNLQGAAYDTSVDGLPFYDTSENKLYILNKSGNIEVKATANTDGTGIISSSEQIDNLFDIDGLVSTSAQIDSLGFLQVNGDGIVSESAQITLEQLTSGSSATDFITEGSTNLYFTDARVKNKLNDELVVSRSAQIVLQDADKTGFTGASSITTLGTVTAGDVSAILPSGVVSQSAQTVAHLLNTATDFGTGRVSGDDFGDAAGTSTFTGSFEGDGSGLTGLATNLIISGGTGNDEVDLLNDALSIIGTTNEIETTVTNNQVQIGLPNDVTIGNDLTVSGNFTVSGTQTIVNSEVLNVSSSIQRLNYGGGAVEGGLEVTDATGTLLTGSLLWDGTNDYWKAGQLGSEEEILLRNKHGVVSGSSQITLEELTSGSSATDFISEGSTNLYYTDARVKTKLTAEDVISGSSQVNFDELNNLPDGLVSQSAQTLVHLHGTGIVSSSAQIDNLFDIDGLVSTSAQTIAHLEGTGIVSSSAQIDDLFNIDGLVSTSAQVVGLLDNQDVDFGTGAISGSSFTGSFVGDGSGLTGLATDLNIADGNGGSDTVALTSDTLTFASSSGAGISIAVTNNTVTIDGVNASTSAKGVASYDSDDFSVSSGNVSIKSGGVRGTNLNSDVAGVGVTYNGTSNALDVDYGSGDDTAVEGSTNITINGTTNQIEITGTAAQALGGAPSYTVGLPDSVTIANALTVNGDVTLGNAADDNVTITGNLSVLGTTTTVNSTTVEIGDNILELNYGGSADKAGIQVTDATGTNTDSGSLVWSGSNGADYWAAGPLGSEKEIARLNAAPTSNTILKADANGLLVDSVLTDDGTDATFSGDVIVDGFGSNANGAFLYADSSNQLTAIAPSNTGDLIQWNGSSFVASNEIDGGTF